MATTSIADFSIKRAKRRKQCYICNCFIPEGSFYAQSGGAYAAHIKCAERAVQS